MASCLAAAYRRRSPRARWALWACRTYRVPRSSPSAIRTDDPLFFKFALFWTFHGHRIRYLSWETSKPAVFQHITEPLSAQVKKRVFFRSLAEAVSAQVATICKKAGLPRLWRGRPDYCRQKLSTPGPCTAGSADSARGPWSAPCRGQRRPRDFSASGR